jgi:hypothetical protein
VPTSPVSLKTTDHRSEQLVRLLRRLQADHDVTVEGYSAEPDGTIVLDLRISAPADATQPPDALTS